MQLKSLKTQDLHKRVQESLKEFFLSSGMKAGDLLPTEAALAESLGVSRTAVREGLRGLEALGIVEPKPGVGRFLRNSNLEAVWDSLSYNLEMSVKDFKEILDVRITLETSYLERDLDKFTEEDIADLERIVNRMEDTVHHEEERQWIKGHTDFHLRLYRYSSNSVLLSLIRIFATIQEKLVALRRYHTGDREKFIAYHRELVRAIATKDKELVRRRLIEHFDEAMSWDNKK